MALKYNDAFNSQSGLSRDQLADKAQSLTDFGNQIPKRDMRSFQRANPNQPFTAQDLSKYNSAQVTAPKPMAAQTAIPVDNIKPRSLIDLSATLPKTDPAPANAMVAGAQATTNNIQSYLDKLALPPTELSQQNEALVSRLGQLYGSQVGKRRDEIQAEKSSGVDAITKQLAEINSDIAKRTAVYDRAFAEAELQPGQILDLVTQRQGAVRRAEAADISLLEAKALRLKGQYDIAKDTASRAVDMKYSVFEEEIAAREKQLQAIKPLLSAEQAKQATAQEMMLSDEKEKIQEFKADSKSNLDLAFTVGTTSKFANKNGKVFRTSDGKPYESQEEFFRDAGVSSWEEAYSKGMVTDITAQQIADKDFVMKLRETYPDAGIEFTDTPQSAASKLKGNSFAYGKDVYMEPASAPAGGVKRDTVKIGEETFYYGDDGMLYPVSNLVNAEGVTATDTEVQTAVQTKALLDQLINDPALSGYTGFRDIRSLFGIVNPISGTATADVKARVDQLKGLLTVDNLKKFLKGPTSDKDIDFIMTTSTGLDPKMSDKAYKARLEEIRSTITNNMKSQGVNLENGGSESTANFNQVKGVQQKAQPMQPIAFHNAIVKTYPQGSRPVETGAASDECGYYARNVVTKMGFTYPTLGDGLNQKREAVAKHGSPIETARPGSVVVTAENPTYGHVAVITGKTANGFIVTESNFKQSGRISHGRIIPFNSPKLIGVINPTKKSA